MMRVQSQQTATGILLMLCFAACACLFLVRPANELRESADNKQTETIEVAMAKVSLPAMTVVILRHINTEMVSRDELPEGKLVSPAQIIGRVLSKKVVEGQILTESCFVTEGAGALLAAAIPPGMRAVTVSVSSKSMPDSIDSILLYPGCIVDVLVAYRLSSRSSEGQVGSATMLRAIHVIAVAGESVVSNPDVEEESGTKKRNTSRGSLVTLLVDTKQAEALHLAVENGSISLSLRNPLDRKIIDFKKTQPLPNNRPDIKKNDIWKRQSKPFVKIDNWKLQPLHDFRIGPCGDVISQRHQSAVVPIRQNPKWEVTVIRGSTVQRIRSEPASSRQQLGLSSLSTTDENGDKWVLDLARGQSLSSLKDSSAKSGPPLLVKTDVQIKGRYVSIDLIVEGQAGEKYAGGVRKNRQRQPAPGFNIVDEAGKVLTSGRFKYG